MEYSKQTASPCISTTPSSMAPSLPLLVHFSVLSFLDLSSSSTSLLTSKNFSCMSASSEFFNYHGKFSNFLNFFLKIIETSSRRRRPSYLGITD